MGRHKDTRDIVHAVMDDGVDYRCMWQITPKELPKDMHPMALELWQNTKGEMVLFQFFIDGKRTGDWYHRVSGWTRFRADLI